MTQVTEITNNIHIMLQEPIFLPFPIQSQAYINIYNIKIKKNKKILPRGYYSYDDDPP